MKETLMISVLAVAAILFAACTGTNFYSTWYPGSANTNPAKTYANVYAGAKFGAIYHTGVTPGNIGRNAAPTKQGKACSNSILWLVAFGDSTIETAKKIGGITKVATVDHSTMGILGFVFHRHCTIVGGE